MLIRTKDALKVSNNITMSNNKNTNNMSPVLFMIRFVKRLSDWLWFDSELLMFPLCFMSTCPSGLIVFISQPDSLRTACLFLKLSLKTETCLRLSSEFLHLDGLMRSIYDAMDKRQTHRVVILVALTYFCLNKLRWSIKNKTSYSSFDLFQKHDFIAALCTERN